MEKEKIVRQLTTVISYSSPPAISVFILSTLTGSKSHIIDFFLTVSGKTHFLLPFYLAE